VQHPEQSSFQLGLFTPGPPVLDAGTAPAVRAIVAKGAMPVPRMPASATRSATGGR